MVEEVLKVPKVQYSNSAVSLHLSSGPPRLGCELKLERTQVVVARKVLLELVLLGTVPSRTVVPLEQVSRTPGLRVVVVRKVLVELVLLGKVLAARLQQDCLEHIHWPQR